VCDFQLSVALKHFKEQADYSEGLHFDDKEFDYNSKFDSLSSR